jgi:hypothetical protein
LLSPAEPVALIASRPSKAGTVGGCGGGGKLALNEIEPIFSRRQQQNKARPPSRLAGRPSSTKAATVGLALGSGSLARGPAAESRAEFIKIVAVCISARNWRSSLPSATILRL